MSRDAPHDPLGRDIACEHVVELPVLGVPVRFEANVADPLMVVESAYGEWRGLAARPDLVSDGRAVVRIIAHAGEEPEGGRSISTRLPDQDRLLLHTSGSVALADIGDRTATAYVTHQLLRADHFVDGIVDALTLFLVTALDRHPIHSAAVVCDGAAVLFAGRSGIGKSTLAYVAHRAGYDLLSDDTTYVQLSPKLRVWGLGRRILLPPSAQSSFPEIAGLPTVLRVGGDQKTAVTPARSSGVLGSLVAERVGICVLERAARPSLVALSPAIVAQRLGASLEPGFDRFAKTTDQVLKRLAGGGAWLLALSESPHENLEYVRQMFAHISTGSSRPPLRA